MVFLSVFPETASPFTGFLTKTHARIQARVSMDPTARSVNWIPRSASSTLLRGARKNPHRPFAVTMIPDAKPVLRGNHFWAVDMIVV